MSKRTRFLKERRTCDETLETRLVHCIRAGIRIDRPTLGISIGRDFYLRRSRRRLGILVRWSKDLASLLESFKAVSCPDSA